MTWFTHWRLMQAKPALLALVVLLLPSSGCVRRDGRNSDCRWPAEAERHPALARHLSAEAEFAEDLAIRYADAHYGLRSPNPSEAYGAERDRCMRPLFAEIAKQHGVPVATVANSLGRNRASIDLAVGVPSYCSIAWSRQRWRGCFGVDIRRPRTAESRAH